MTYVSARGGNLSATEAKQMITEAQENMMEIKERMDTDREKQEKALHERLSQRKKEKMAELVGISEITQLETNGSLAL